MERELLLKLFSLFIVKFPIAVKLLFNPFTVICGMILLIVESSLAVDFVVVEVAFIIGAVVVDQFTVPLFQAIFAHALVLYAVLVNLLQVDEIGLFLLHHVFFDLFLDLRKVLVTKLIGAYLLQGITGCIWITFAKNIGFRLEILT